MSPSSFDFLTMPLWLIGLLLLILLVAAREVGAWARQRLKPTREDQDDTFAMNSVLGMLALLIGFSFSIAVNRYDSRRQAVVHEANAIGTTWLRTDLLQQEERTAMQEVLRRYVDARVRYGNASSGVAENEAFAKTEQLQAELWAVMMRAAGPALDTPRGSLLVTTTNEAIDLASERHAERQAHIPDRILRMLFLFALVSAALVGYERGTQRRATTLLLLLVALAGTLVLDLDRPSAGKILEPQEPMLALQRSMGALPIAQPPR
ncbi:MAG TPA: hypothetical protein VM469_14230 [Pseudoxanthomonas sp.]|nr:hypothetical protein [Pseudoxanthomonas sp.]